MSQNNLVEGLAEKYGIDKQAFIDTVKATVFKGATNAQLYTFFAVCREHNFNPFTKMVWAYPDKSGGVQTMISYSGWIQLANNHPQFDGEETTFVIDNQTQKPISATCIVWRKDRTHPTIVTVYFTEWYKGSNPNWVDRPIHMLGIRAYIQAVRKAFGLHQFEYEGEYNESPIIDMPNISETQQSANDLAKLVQDTTEEYRTIPTQPVPESTPEPVIIPESNKIPDLIPDELPESEPVKPKVKRDPTAKILKQEVAQTQSDDEYRKIYLQCAELYPARQNNAKIQPAQKEVLDLLLDKRIRNLPEPYNNVVEITKILSFLNGLIPDTVASEEVEDPEVAAMKAMWGG